MGINGAKALHGGRSSDKGAAGGITTTSAKKNIFVFFFNQKGLIAGLGLQRTKISKLQPGKPK